MRPLAFLVGALALKAASGRPSRRRHAVAVTELAPIALPPVSVPAVGASSVTATAWRCLDGRRAHRLGAGEVGLVGENLTA